MITKSLIMAIILIESGGNPIAQSPMGALGLTQMTPIAIQEVQNQYDISGDLNIFNSEENIRYGVLLFEHYLRQCRTIRGALICYNGGYAAYRSYLAHGLGAAPEETQAYVGKVLALARSLDPMFSRELPERDRDTYLRTAIDNVFDELYGAREDVESVVFGPRVPPIRTGSRTPYLYR
jgi:soluble lytic murein transglycosylase-like protein